MSEVDQNGSLRAKTGGRLKGTPNRLTTELREAITYLVRGNIGKVQEWLDRVAVDSPAKAVELLMGLSRYALPELKAIAIDVQERPRDVRRMSMAELQALIEDNSPSYESAPLVLPNPAS